LWGTLRGRREKQIGLNKGWAKKVKIFSLKKLCPKIEFIFSLKKQSFKGILKIKKGDY